MRRKVVGRKEKFPVLPDLQYSSYLISKLINKVMKDGMKEKARKIVNFVLEKLRKEYNKDPVQIFKEVVEKCRPEYDLESRKFGGANQRIPHNIGEERGIKVFLRWLVNFSRDKKGSSMKNSLYSEIKGMYDNTSTKTMEKRNSVHKEAIANMVFAGRNTRNK